MEETLYRWMFYIGGGILLIQVVLQLIGLEGEADVDADTDFEAGDIDGNWFFGLLSFKAILAFISAFGITGLMLLDADMSAPLRVLYSTLAGCAAFVVIGWLMKLLHDLSYSGTVELANALGSQGSVYLRIPAKKTGKGKITLEIQGRTVELAAITDGEAIATGQTVRVVELLGDETVMVSKS